MSLIFLLLLLLIGGFGLSMGTGPEDSVTQLQRAIPRWAATQGHSRDARYLAGARLFVESGCANCHTYLGSGSSNLGAPDLTSEGAKNKGIQFQIDHLKCPSCVNPGSPMPAFAALGEERLRQLATFLEASKGPK